MGTMGSAAIKRCSMILLGLLIAFSGLGARAAAEISGETLEKEQSARYYINYASYLIDVGKYLEALENYEAAEEATTLPKTKADALLAKAALLSSFLDAPEEALKVYQDVRAHYPQAAEIALYREGILLFDLQRYPRAREILEVYLNTYPQGRFRYQAEALIREIAKTQASQPAPEPAPAHTPGPAQPVAPSPPVPSVVPAPPVPASPPVSPPSAPPAAPPVAAPVTPPAVVVAPVPFPTASPLPAPAAAASPPPEVRVRMCQTTGQARIEGRGVCVAGMGCRDRFVLGLKDGRILVNGVRSASNTPVFESDQPLKVVCGDQAKQVRGRLTAMVRDGKLLVINVLNIEAYLLSVVPSENPASWPVESLKAQAVAARTYAYYQLLHRKNWAYDLVDYAGDQAYGGIVKEQPRSTEAVRATAGEVLTYDAKPILAMFSANSGGYTADSQAIFNLYKPYLVSRRDPASLKGGMANWSRKYTTAEVVAHLRKINIDARGLRAIEPVEQAPSGRIIKVRLVLADGRTKVFRNRTTLRRALDLPEILCAIRLQGGTYIFEGHGWGHGVGYSQWGSALMGKEKKYKEILAFYYGDARLEKLW
jgi:stage II sporulation protein D